ncbi:MAG: DUF565 domain-containing protein [Cyanobacteria bacterium J06627_28]
MQRTRLNTLANQATVQFRQWVFNPWRRLSVLVISLLGGNFFATAISATAGQAAKLDVTISAILVIVVEIISWLYYRSGRSGRSGARQRSVDIDAQATDLFSEGAAATTNIDLGPVRSRSTLIEALNAFKLGVVYGLFVEAFKLGS